MKGSSFARQALLISGIMSLGMGFVSSYRILVIPFPWESHCRQLEQIAQKLQEIGHSVILVLPNSESYASGIKLPKLVYDARGVLNDTLLTVAHRRIRTGEGFKDWAVEYLTYQNDLVERMFEDERFDQAAKKSDFVLTDTAFTGVVAVMDYYDLPFTALSPWGFTPGLFGDLFGIPDDPSYIPTMGLDAFFEISGSSDDMNIVERMINLVWLQVGAVFREVITSYCLNPIRKKYMKKSVVDKWRDASLVLVPTDFSFEYPQALPPNVRAIGPLTVQEGKSLPLLFESIVTFANQDIVIVNFGGALALPKHSFRKIVNVLLKLDQPVLWRFSRKEFFAHLHEETGEGLREGFSPQLNHCINANEDCTSYRALGTYPSPATQLQIKDHGEYLSVNENLLIFDWFPQNDLLSHPKVKLFISHCGTNSVYEAIFHRVASVCMPLFGDHWQNAKRVETRQVGLVLPFSTWDESDMVKAIKGLADNAAISEGLRLTSGRLKIRKRSSAEEAAELIETFMAYDSTLFLRPRGADLSFFVRHYFDVFGVIVLAVYFFRWSIKYVRFLISKSF